MRRTFLDYFINIDMSISSIQIMEDWLTNKANKYVGKLIILILKCYLSYDNLNQIEYDFRN